MPRLLFALPFLPFTSGSSPSLKDRIEGAYFGTLVADALTLGSHYEYDATVLKSTYSKTIKGDLVETLPYLAPGELMGGSTHGVGWGRRNYHPGQKKGDNTDYGLYNELVLEYLSEDGLSRGVNSKIELSKFVKAWRTKLESESGWGAWKCTQTKQALQQIQQGQTEYKKVGGMSNAMAYRAGPLFAVYDNEEKLVKALKKVSFTHANREALLGGEFFARVTFRLIHLSEKNSSIREVIESVRDTMSPDNFIIEQVRKGIEKFEEVSDPKRPLGKEEFVDDLAMTSMARLWDVGKTEPIKVGKASPTEGTMPSSIYMILKYATRGFGSAARANALVGGDNASRSVAIGSVLGAWFGVQGVAGEKNELKTGLNAWKRSEEKLRMLPLLRAKGEEL